MIGLEGYVDDSNACKSCDNYGEHFVTFYKVMNRNWTIVECYTDEVKGK